MLSKRATWRKGRQPASRGRGRAKVRLDPGTIAVIALGGAIGAPLRVEMLRLIPAAPGGFPWGTLWVNLSGSFLLGFLVVLLERLAPSRYARAFLGTGVIGAYTTFSTFVVEIDLLVTHGRLATAFAYAALSIGVGFGAVLAGMRSARSFPNSVRSGGG